MDLSKQMSSSKCSFTCICRLCSVCILPQPACYSQSAVRSLRFTLTEFKLRDHMDRRITLPKQVTSPTWGPLPP